MSSKRYYWLKLKEDFFDEDTIEWLEEQENGRDYVLFYLKLCLKSLKTDGHLIRAVGDMLIPYEVKKLAEATHTDFDTAVVAMELLKQIGLVEVLDSGEIYLTKLHEMVGSGAGNANAQRQKRFRDRKKQALLGGVSEGVTEDVTGVTEGVTNSNGEIEYRDKEIELDKEIETDKEKATARQSDGRGSKSVIDQEFDNLWTLYPRKQGKANALKAYTKARKGKPEIYQQVEAGIKAYVAYIKANGTDPRYIKQGSTWFNQRAWEDDYATTAVPSGVVVPDKYRVDKDYSVGFD